MRLTQEIAHIRAGLTKIEEAFLSRYQLTFGWNVRYNANRQSKRKC